MNDWYHLTILSPSRVQVLLEGIPKNKDYDLYDYDHNKAFPLYVSDRYDSTDEEIRFWPTPGLKYWIRVLSYQGPKPPPPPNNYSQEPYRLTVSTIK